MGKKVLSTKKSTYIMIRTKEAEKAKLQAAADKEGVYLSQWARQVLDAAADEVLNK